MALAVLVVPVALVVLVVKVALVALVVLALRAELVVLVVLVVLALKAELVVKVAKAVKAAPVAWSRWLSRAMAHPVCPMIGTSRSVPRRMRIVSSVLTTITGTGQASTPRVAWLDWSASPDKENQSSPIH